MRLDCGRAADTASPSPSTPGACAAYASPAAVTSARPIQPGSADQPRDRHETCRARYPFRHRAGTTRPDPQTQIISTNTITEAFTRPGTGWAHPSDSDRRPGESMPPSPADSDAWTNSESCSWRIQALPSSGPKHPSRPVARWEGGARVRVRGVLHPQRDGSESRTGSEIRVVPSPQLKVR
jgi:hypothetical protein